MIGSVRQFGSDLKQAFRQWREDDGNLLAASVAYYAALSFFPLLLILFSGLGAVLQFTPWGQNAQTRVIHIVAEQASPRLADQVAQILENVQQSAAVNGPIGVITLLITAVAIFVHFERAFDRIWDAGPRARRGFLAATGNFLFNRLKAFLMLLGLGGLLIVVFVGGLVLSAVEARASGVLPLGSRFWQLVQSGVSLVLNGLVISSIYRVMSKARADWSASIRGGLLVSVIWEAGRQLLASYIVADKFSAYGVVGSFIAVMLWIFYASAIIFFGAEFVQVISSRHNATAPHRTPSRTSR